MKIDREALTCEARLHRDYITLDGCTDEKAVEKGCKFRAWVGDSDLGGWLGDSESEFLESVLSEMDYAGIRISENVLLIKNLDP